MAFKFLFGVQDHYFSICQYLDFCSMLSLLEIKYICFQQPTQILKCLKEFAYSIQSYFFERERFLSEVCTMLTSLVDFQRENIKGKRSHYCNSIKLIFAAFGCSTTKNSLYSLSIDLSLERIFLLQKSSLDL